jgi:hypothetical protein
MVRLIESVKLLGRRTLDIVGVVYTPNSRHDLGIKSPKGKNELELLVLNKNNMPNETQEEFLKDLNPDNKPDVLTAPLTPPAEQATEEQETDEDKFNRRERRLQSKLQAERESAIALAARLEALTEAQKFRQDSEPEEYLKAVEKIYGTSTPEATEATELLKTAIQGAERRATERALEQFREEQRDEYESVAVEERNLDEMVESIEAQTGRDMDDQERQGFFQLLERLSPKDRDGNIIEYADADAVWEELQARKQVQPSRARDLAARSMVRTGASTNTSVEDTSNERWLRENGII